MIVIKIEGKLKYSILQEKDKKRNQELIYLDFDIDV